MKFPADGPAGERGAHVPGPVEGEHNIASAPAPSLEGPAVLAAPRNIGHAYRNNAT